jgi:hypothetical protein
MKKTLLKNRRIGVTLSLPVKINDFQYAKVQAEYSADLPDGPKKLNAVFAEMWDTVDKQVKRKKKEIEEQQRPKRNPRLGE